MRSATFIHAPPRNTHQATPTPTANSNHNTSQFAAPSTSNALRYSLYLLRSCAEHRRIGILFKSLSKQQVPVPVPGFGSGSGTRHPGGWLIPGFSTPTAEPERLDIPGGPPASLARPSEYLATSQQPATSKSHVPPPLATTGHPTHCHYHHTPHFVFAFRPFKFKARELERPFSTSLCDGDGDGKSGEAARTDQG
jgi:hypothetical protein